MDIGTSLCPTGQSKNRTMLCERCILEYTKKTIAKSDCNLEKTNGGGFIVVIYVSQLIAEVFWL
jgi:hypothetical protein